MLDWTNHARTRMQQRLKTVPISEVKAEDLVPITKSVHKRFAAQHPRGEGFFNLNMRLSKKNGVKVMYHKDYDTLFVVSPIGTLGNSYTVITVIPSKTARCVYS